MFVVLKTEKPCACMSSLRARRKKKGKERRKAKPKKITNTEKEMRVAVEAKHQSIIASQQPHQPCMRALRLPFIKKPVQCVKR